MRLGLIFVTGSLIVLAIFSAQASAQTLTTLSSFDGTNGAGPGSGLILSGSTIYGTAWSGGANNDGTVFSMPVGGGAPTTLFSFDGTHGDGPSGGLILSGSTLYGTTFDGGANNDGTVFSIPVGGGTPTVLHSFGGTDGELPDSGLILSGSTLYGVTEVGGANGQGTVFSLPVGGGAPTTLLAFDFTNGELPFDSLILKGSTLYGTTPFAGSNDSGTVFSIPVNGGAATTLCSFGGANGTAFSPQGSLTLSADGSTLYGTSLGGANGLGTVFSVPVGGGTPTVLFSFGATDNCGSGPQGTLTLSADGSTLYGMTSSGGANNLGAVFSMPVGGGAPTVLFPLDCDLAGSAGSLTLSGSTLYGTTGDGGNMSLNFGYGDGTVFALHLLPGDANGDGRVDINDLTIVLTNFGQTGMTWSQGDFIGDGTVDINDLTIVLATFGSGVSAAGPSAVPEPSALVLLAAALLAALVYACRRAGRCRLGCARLDVSK